MIELVETANAPLANGHYSQAVIANGFVFVAGQLPIIPGTDGKIPSGIEAQTRRVISNVAAILEAANSGLDQLVNVSLFITDISHWPTVDRVYSEQMQQHRPARVVTVSPQLHRGTLVVLQAVAVTR